jgi:hypothetical protein
VTTPPVRPARWWQKLICWTQGHNLIGVELPEGYSWQTCRTCGQPIEGYRPPKRAMDA